MFMYVYGALAVFRLMLVRSLFTCKLYELIKSVLNFYMK